MKARLASFVIVMALVGTFAVSAPRATAQNPLRDTTLVSLIQALTTVNSAGGTSALSTLIPRSISCGRLPSS